MAFQYKCLKSLTFMADSVQVGTRRQSMFLKQNSQGDKWIRAVADIGRINGPFQVEFQAVRSYSYAGDIAIDDISFDGCALPVAGPKCYSSQFTCGRFDSGNKRSSSGCRWCALQ